MEQVTQDSFAELNALHDAYLSDRTDEHLEAVNDYLRGLSDEELGAWVKQRYAQRIRDFSCLHLCSANLCRARLSNANLHRANLPGVKLSYARLSYARLSYARLSYADLSGAELSYAELSYAELSGAKLAFANLSGAKLAFANLSGADLSEAIFDTATVLPDGTNWTPPETDMSQFTHQKEER